jgi:hypothetical protein
MRVKLLDVMTCFKVIQIRSQLISLRCLDDRLVHKESEMITLSLHEIR